MYKIVIIFIFLIILFYYISKPKSQNKKIIKPILKKKRSHKKRKNKRVKFQKEIKREPKKINKNLVFMEIGIDREIIGKIIIKLYEEHVPYTCKNFKTLCMNRENLAYRGSPFHRIIKDFMIQGGDFTRGDGTGGVSIYGERFQDENFIFKHNRPYLLSMANSGPDTNGSQFFITTVETPHLDNKHVIFGEVINGFEIIDYLNNIKTDENDRPLQNIFINDCGVL
jgi:cyclophilin family peptidyl-prolyl cis-trans isomerase